MPVKFYICRLIIDSCEDSQYRSQWQLVTNDPHVYVAWLLDN